MQCDGRSVFARPRPPGRHPGVPTVRPPNFRRLRAPAEASSKGGEASPVEAALWVRLSAAPSGTGLLALLGETVARRGAGEESPVEAALWVRLIAAPSGTRLPALLVEAVALLRPAAPDCQRRRCSLSVSLSLARSGVVMIGSTVGSFQLCKPAVVFALVRLSIDPAGLPRYTHAPAPLLVSADGWCC